MLRIVMVISCAITTIRVFHTLILGPSAVADLVVLRVDAKALENINSRGAATPAAYKKLLSPKDYAKFERCKAANVNGYEMFSLLVATIFGGMYAKLLDRAMNRIGLWLVLLRGMYNELYMRTETKRGSYWQSAV